MAQIISSSWHVEDFEDRAEELGVSPEHLMDVSRKVFLDRLAELGNEIISELTL